MSQIEHKIFEICEKSLGYSNFSRDERRAARSLADDRNIVIKKIHKRSCVVAWDRSDYVIEAEKQLNDSKVYKDISDSNDSILKLTEKSNKIFESLKRRGFIGEKQLKYFRFDFKKACNL